MEEYLEEKSVKIEVEKNEYFSADKWWIKLSFWTKIIHNKYKRSNIKVEYINFKRNKVTFLFNNINKDLALKYLLNA